MYIFRNNYKCLNIDILELIDKAHVNFPSDLVTVKLVLTYQPNDVYYSYNSISKQLQLNLYV